VRSAARNTSVNTIVGNTHVPAVEGTLSVCTIDGGATVLIVRVVVCVSTRSKGEIVSSAMDQICVCIKNVRQIV
jgi:hypothetical protein